MSTSILYFCLIFLASICISTEINLQQRPSVGVIRWNAWNFYNGQYDIVFYYLHRSLSPEEFHYRIPFYVSVLSPTNISFDGDQQSVMDQEILYAKLDQIVQQIIHFVNNIINKHHINIVQAIQIMD